jgi:hypothetical protein
MALLSALFSLIARQLSTVLQAIFGWSITALFGKLPSRMQTALSVALLLSFVWPFLVLGCFLPAAAAWAIAFVPLHQWMSRRLALRIVWLGLTVVVPIAVGAITRWITPKRKLKKGLVLTLLGGYPMTVGYAFAFFVTALTVPVVKVLSMKRHWEDAHVFLQAREGSYAAVLGALIEACRRVDVGVVREDVPASMALATNASRRLAKPFIEPTIGERPQRLRGENLELYLYPADLLLRGSPRLVAHVRAAMTRTDLEACAYLVESDEARAIQDEIGRLAVVTRDDERERAPLLGRVREVSRRLDRASITFEEWTALETLLRRLERRALGQRDLLAEASDSSAVPWSRPQPARAAAAGTLVPRPRPAEA